MNDDRGEDESQGRSGAEVSSVAAALARAKALGLERFDAQRLVGAVLGRPRAWLAAHPDAPLDANQSARLEALYARHADDEPLGYLTGHEPFRQLELAVDRRVLVPRPDTEVLVDWAIECLAAAPEPAPRVVDLGTGSGAVALAVAQAAPRARVLATDASADALAVARANAARLGLALDWRQGDWWDAAGDARFELALSNPPYIAADDPHLAALRHEPIEALVSGADGLDAIRTLVAGAPAHLAPGGRLLLEHGFDQAAAVRALFEAHGYASVETRRDAGGRDRCTGGRWPGGTQKAACPS